MSTPRISPKTAPFIKKMTLAAKGIRHCLKQMCRYHLPVRAVKFSLCAGNNVFMEGTSS